MVIWWLAAVVMAVAALIRERGQSVQTLGVMVATLVGSVACITFLRSRPAGTTLSDVCFQLLGYGAIFMTITPWPRVDPRGGRRIGLCATHGGLD